MAPSFNAKGRSVRRGRGRKAPFRFELHGVKELDRALGELPKAVSKSVLRKALRKSARPVVRDAKANATRGATGNLRKSLRAGTTLSRNQMRGRVKMGDVELFIGAAWPLGAHAHLIEFGTSHHGAHPFLRPAWDANRVDVLNTVGEEIWAELEKTAGRLARRAEAGTLPRSHARHLAR